MNSDPSGLERYSLWAKNFLRFKEIVGVLFYGFTLYCREYFGFDYIVRDALGYNQVFSLTLSMIIICISCSPILIISPISMNGK